jgi:hypothetical protein
MLYLKKKSFSSLQQEQEQEQLTYTWIINEIMNNEQQQRSPRQLATAVGWQLFQIPLTLFLQQLFLK